MTKPDGTAESADQHALHTIARRFDAWLMDKALPLWWARGADLAQGGFFEGLSQDGTPLRGFRRTRVQGRQSWVYAVAGAMGWKGPWQPAAEQGLAYLEAKYRRTDGQFSTSVSENGTVLDATGVLYDHTFVLLAMAQLYKNFPARTGLAQAARELMQTQITLRRHPAGGFREDAEQPFQSNAHMHLLEAALAWCDADPGNLWDGLADEIAELCLSRFIDPKHGFIREFFDSSWAPQVGDAGRHVEPGHQFEWSWLLERWGLLRGHEGARRAARTLFEIGTRGVDPGRGVAIDDMWDDFTAARPTARLWPQAERIKSAIALMTASTGPARTRYRAEAIAASNRLWRYLETPIAGLWWDRMATDGNFISEPAPASSFYHIICCISVLRQGCDDK